MDNRHVQDDLAAYALDILDPGEVAAVEHHLAGCRTCRAAYAELREAAEELAWTVPEASPRPGLRDAILGGLTVRPTRRLERWSRLRPILAAAAAIAIFLLGFGSASFFGRLSRPGPEVDLGDVFNPARVQVAVLQPTENAPQATARAYFEPDRKEIVLAVDDLPPAPPGQVYQLWANAGNRRWSAGTFTGDQPIYRFTCPREMGLYDSLGVTVEPAGGRAEPSGPRVLAGPIPKT
ncbi:MAG TPA: anti-sigma factor [Dehalococcoidia bacterium]|nr:anti-sigma factor [Dehalococcoidia bacterium]